MYAFYIQVLHGHILYILPCSVNRYLYWLTINYYISISNFGKTEKYAENCVPGDKIDSIQWIIMV